jgi:hypothetical protein
MAINHDNTCDRASLGWTLLRIEEEQGPDLCATVSEVRRAREEYRDAGLLPWCSCLERQILTTSQHANLARKAGDEERYLELLAERHDLEQERRATA